MILAKTFECSVPSPNAVKDAVIYCVTQDTKLPEIWSAAGTWAGAVATVAALLFALRQSREAKQIAEDSAELSRAQHDENRQIPALGAYATAWRKLIKPDSFASDDLRELLMDATAAGEIWRNVNSRNRSDRDQLDRLESSIVEIAFQVQFGGDSRSRKRDWVDSGLASAIQDLVLIAGSWQTAEVSDRAKFNERARIATEILNGHFQSFKDYPKPRANRTDRPAGPTN